jgi:hypothetical protein
MQEQNKGIPLYSNWNEQEIKNPALLQPITAWQGSNEISFKLLLCLEALRDLEKNMESLSKLNNPNTDQRLVKQLASPLYSLASGVKGMFNELNGNAKNYTVIASKQHKGIIRRQKHFTSNVPMDNQSDLRIVRDKIDSHIDKEAVIKPENYWAKVDLRSFLKWMGVCLEQILYFLSLDVYGWTRDSGDPNIWSLMSVDGTLVNWYMKDEKPFSIVDITFVKSPKYGVLSEVKTFVTLYNEVARKCKGVNLIEISEEM